jgi:hypothetical protein
MGEEILESIYSDICEYTQTEHAVDKKVYEDKKEKCYEHMKDVLLFYRDDVHNAQNQDKLNNFTFQISLNIVLVVLTEICQIKTEDAKDFKKQNACKPEILKIVGTLMSEMTNFRKDDDEKVIFRIKLSK